MICSLRGILIDTDSSSFVVECGGVGYRCTASMNTLFSLPKINDSIFVYTYMAVREDAVDLFGFLSMQELDMFKLLITVNGIGPKAAVSILSAFKPEEISLCVASGDAKSLTRANGIGLKSAQRVVLELKDKVSAVGVQNNTVEAVAAAVSGSNSSEAISALVALGYSQSEASAAVGKSDLTLPTEQIIKNALKELARRV